MTPDWLVIFLGKGTLWALSSTCWGQYSPVWSSAIATIKLTPTPRRGYTIELMQQHQNGERLDTPFTSYLTRDKPRREIRRSLRSENMINCKILTFFFVRNLPIDFLIKPEQPGNFRRVNLYLNLNCEKNNECNILSSF